MRPGHRRPSFRPLALAFVFWSTTHRAALHVRADSLSSTNVTSSEWERILRNNQGEDACSLQQWLASDCPQNSDNNGEAVARRLIHARDEFDFTPTNCTCTLAYFNLLCGCRLSRDEPIDSIYETWESECQANNAVEMNATSIRALDVNIPPWAFITPNNGTFNSMEILLVANPTPTRSSPVPIIVSVIISLSASIVAMVVFFYWRRYKRAQRKGTFEGSFFAYVRKLFTPRAPSIRHRDRNEEWVIDERQERVVNDNENDRDSLFRRREDHPFHVESPNADPEISHWSPSTDASPHPRPHRRYSFTPRPSNLGVEQSMFGVSTMKVIGERVKSWIPWANRPVPVTNTRRTTGYNIDGDGISIRNRPRNNTSSTMSKALGRYATISEDDKEDVDAVGTGRTRATKRVGGESVITDEDRAAVAESVIVIGDADFTLESGSSNHGQLRPVPKASLRDRTGIDNFNSPVAVNWNVEPPSPTLESVQLQSPSVVPKSPGAPPLLPPPPQEKPPLPPVTARSTPRRTPSPHLRISTQFDEPPIDLYLSGHNHNNLNPRAPAISGPQRPTSRIPPSFSQQAPPGHHHQDTSSSSGSVSGVNALSYVTLPNTSYPPPHPSTLRNDNPIVGQNPTSSNNRDPVGSVIRPLPQQPGSIPTAPKLAHQASDSSMDQYSILRVPNGSRTNGLRMSSNEDPKRISQQSEFDPYSASGILRPPSLQPNRHPDAQHLHPLSHRHQRSTSSTSLPRSPGEPAGHAQRGWSVDDDVDRSSLLLDQPMKVDDGMSGSRGVYIATPRDVTTLTSMPTHYRTFSNESFTTVKSDSGLGTSFEGSGFNSGSDRLDSGASMGLTPNSPTLGSLEMDPHNSNGFARYAGRESISGSSGWDASTQAHSNDSPIEPPMPVLGRSPNIGARSLAEVSPNLTPNRTLSPNLDPIPGHARLGSDNSLSLRHSRSREEMVNPAKNDPVRLFPAVVRAAGYTTGLSPGSGPLPIPTPPRTPQPSVGRGGGTNRDGTWSGHTPHSSFSSQQGLTGTGAFAGYVERDRSQPSRGATWGTESSGIESVFESVQQLPDVYPQVRNVSGDKRTP